MSYQEYKKLLKISENEHLGPGSYLGHDTHLFNQNAVNGKILPMKYY